jgi:hypothetical protein
LSAVTLPVQSHALDRPASDRREPTSRVTQPTEMARDFPHACLPSAARVGLQLAWLEVLRERHPGVTWVAVEAKTKEPAASRGLGRESDAA